jgi:hypothetical protein
MTTIPREELQTLFERLAFPSALQLRKAVNDKERARAARFPRPPEYEPWHITVKDAKEFVSKAGQRQILARTQPFDGKIAAGGLNQRWAADVISYKAQPAQIGDVKMRYILIVQDIFSREIWTAALPEINAASVAKAFRSILTKSRRRPRELNTDGGGEFKAEFQAVLRADDRIGEEAIEHRVSEQQNDIATLDAAILKLRRALTRITSTPGRSNWAEELQAATEAYNETPHGGILGEAPEKVSGTNEESKSLQFDLLQQNAEKYEQQSSVFKRKRERLKDATAFRVQIKQRQGTGLARRGYKPTYEKDIVRITNFDSAAGIVTGIKGAGPGARGVTRSIREVMPVPIDSTTVRDPPGQGATRDESVEERRRKKTKQLFEKVNEFLNMPRTLLSIRKHIGTEGVQLIKNNRLQNITRFMELWGFRQVEKKWQRGEAASGSAGSAGSGVRQTKLK